jgi:hypothetical protein
LVYYDAGADRSMEFKKINGADSSIEAIK